jgi:hypothetical protein
VPGIGGVLIHTGHVEPRLDASCGTWGYLTLTLEDD